MWDGGSWLHMELTICEPPFLQEDVSHLMGEIFSPETCLLHGFRLAGLYAAGSDSVAGGHVVVEEYPLDSLAEDERDLDCPPQIWNLHPVLPGRHLRLGRPEALPELTLMEAKEKPKLSDGVVVDTALGVDRRHRPLS